MAPPAAISPLLVPQTDLPLDFEETKTQLATVHVPCRSLTNKALTKWLHKENKSHLNILQAAWSLSFRSYTGSEDVWFSCLNPKRSYYCHVSPLQPVRTLFDLHTVDSAKANNTTFWGANTVLYVNEHHKDKNETPPFDGLGQFDLAAYLSQRPEMHAPGIGIHYSPSVISSELAEMIVLTVIKAMEEIVFHIDSRIEVLEMCSDADINRLARWNPVEETPPAHTIHQVITQNSNIHPDSIAVSAWDGELTYQELDRISSGLAIWLRQLGVGPETFVSLVFDKSKWAVVAQLGVLKAGGAYFFVNPSHPVHYSRNLGSSLSPIVSVCSPKYSSLAEELACEVVAVGDAVRELLESIPVDDEPPSPTLDTNSSNAMYITFTSGTTGVPKGIVTEHAAFYNMAMANGKALQVDHTTRMLQFASYSFDVSNRDTLITLMFGGCVCIPSEDERLNDLAGFLNRHSVTLASLTPSMASTLSPDSCPSLQGLVLGGEPMAESHISTWAKHLRLYNAYGVSESTGIAALASDIKPGCSPSNIGYGCGSNLWVVAIDQPDKLAPIGALGELVIEGPSVSRGYLGDKERTGKHFTSNGAWRRRINEQFGDHQPGKRAFRTGDLVRYNLDGSLQLAGRRDHQVKVNGQRLELTAVEHHIAACAQVSGAGFNHTAVVAVKEKTSGSTKLVAFLGRETSRETHTPSQMLPEQLNDMEDLRDGLKRHLMDGLPTYMVPSEFIFLQHMPLTTSGKLNRLLLQNTATQMLLDTKREAFNGTALTSDQVPTTPREKHLAQTWAKLLGVGVTGIARDDCFFRSGADSMAAIKMAASLRQDGFAISVSDIFKHSVLSDMASMLVKDNKHQSSSTPAPFSLLNKRQTTLGIIEATGLHMDEIEDAYPSTHMQQGLIALTAKDSHAYIGSYTWQLADIIDRQKFMNAWKMVWLNNPILRTRVVQTPDGIFQVVVNTDMPWKTVSNVTACSMEIDINQGPLVRFYVDKESFRLDIHHSLYDEWSLDLILAQVEDAYKGQELHYQPFSPFVQHLAHESDAGTEKFWRQEFSGLEVEHFPGTSPKPGDAVEKVMVETDLQLDAEISTKYTLSSILRLAWAIILSQKTGSDDIVFGATVSGRNAHLDGIDQLSGPTLATLPVRIKLPMGKSVREGLAQVHDQFVNMIPHEQTGLLGIRSLGKEAAEACNFQNLLVVQPKEQKLESSIFKTTTGSASSSENAKAFASYPMVLTCRPEKGRVSLKAAFDSTVMTPDDGHSFVRQLMCVIQQIVASDSMRIADISLVPSQDMAKLKEWNRPLPKSVSTCIHHRIRWLSTAQPEALAIHSSHLDLTYAQLENYSNIFAQHLTSEGVRQGDFVPLLLERSPWAPVMILAVLKTGAAFVLLDLSHPIQRLRTMCTMINAKILVSFKEHSDISVKLALPVTIFDPDTYTQAPSRDTIISEPGVSIATPSLNTPACVVFSSGSTGVPKGIVLPHGAIATSATVMREHGMLTPNSRVFHFASFAFDISIGEILFTLAAGACVCVPQEEERRGNPAKAAGDLKVTWALLTPSVINLFDPSDVPTLEILGSCGEPLTTQIVDIWAERLKLFAMYAPAECTVISHIGRILPDTHHSNIGRSFGAVSWVADPSNHNRLVPIGTPGELIIEGPVVSSGYLNDREKTDQVFIKNPSWLSEARPNSDSGRMYKTGDLVRQMPDGSLQFLGRKDDQVKLHGQRLEVGEVEHCITSVCIAVKSAAVECIKIPDQNNRMFLVAFIAPHNKGDWGQTSSYESGAADLDLIGSPNDQFYSTIESLYASMKELLPTYMLPSYFMPLGHVPLSLSGKVNRRLLREQSRSQLLDRLDVYQLRARTVNANELPVTEHDRELQQIVSQALNLDPSSVFMNSNFFGLGGDSISAMVVSTLAKRKGIHLAVAKIFTHQVLSKIAASCAPKAEEDYPTDNELIAPAANGGKISLDKLPSHIPQDIVDNVVEASPATEFQVMTLFNFYSRYLWISLPDGVGQEQLLAACDALVQKHSILRTVFYTSDDKSIIQLTLRTVPVNLVRYSDVDDMHRHFADDSLAMKVPIDGETGFQVQLLTLRDSRTFLALRLPHALFDGMSLSTICDDLSAAYSGNTIPSCAQFSDHIRHVWKKRTPETYRLWKDVLGDTPMTRMDTKFFECETESSQIGSDLDQPRGVTARAETASISPPTGTTMATLVKLAWAITLSRLFTPAHAYGLNDVVFGQVVHGRGLGIPHEDRIVGPCLNIIPVRVHFSSTPDTQEKGELLSQVQRQHIETMPVENLGLGEIAQNCTTWEPGTKFGSFVRFQNFTNNDDPTCSFDGRTCETGLYSVPNRPSQTANVLVVPYADTMAITMTVSSEVLDEEAADYVNFLIEETGGRPMIERISKLVLQSQPHAEINVHAPIQGDFFPDLETHDLIILTGGPFNLLQHERPSWVINTLNYIQLATANRTKPKILGICWGQQAIALALGGALGKSERGHCKIHKNHEIVVTDIGNSLSCLAPNNEILISKDNQVLTFQGHPEMDKILSQLFVATDGQLSSPRPELVTGLESIDAAHDGELIFKAIMNWASKDIDPELVL
ncbi:nonribosomal peptide synthetase [Fusarium austroafricanum]|uniref:Nonribosomal peptide synthetase n=1 Tax=Fusarium austroafricanum TaxID=2364996 RepID=A0A8H4NU49_9HYPO|nr:nonribosomal peptide synthetase [Fusarium austroafricanum]